MKYIMPALRFKILMILIPGFIYPLSMTGLAQLIFPSQANGSLVEKEGKIVGAALIGQNFEKPEYFWPRPSAIGYSPLPSGGSNLGPASQDLKKAVVERRNKLKLAHADQIGEPPPDLLFASASGLDPHISKEAAIYQLSRVAKARNRDIKRVKELIEQATEERQWGILGEVTVNVLRLNLSLDRDKEI